MLEIKTNSPEETIRLGEKIGSLLQSGDVIALTGELGAGKTTFIKGLAKGIGVSDFVGSPSFVIINEYPGRIPFYHMDLYRLEDRADIEGLGITEYFSGRGIVAVEWAEKLGEILPDVNITVTMEPFGENGRRIIIDEKGIDRLGGKL